MPDPVNNPNQPGKELFTGAKQFMEIIQLVIGIVGGITAVVSLFKNALWFLAVGVLVVLISVAWYLIQKHWKRRRPPKFVTPNDSIKGGAYLRGLLPFESGERILGRDIKITG